MGEDDSRQTETAPLSQLAREADQSRGVALVVYHRDGAEVATLRQGHALVVGRVPPADLVVPDPSLSRQHARFRLQGDEVIVEDLGSTNGTWLEGESIETVAVRPGSVVTLGAATAVLKPLSAQALHGMAGHDRFAVDLEAEVTRARFFERSFSLAMVRSVEPESSPVHQWLERVQRCLRPVDRIALYSPDTVEVLLPEVSLEAAAEIGGAIAASGEPELAFAVSAFPESSTTAEGLVDTCRHALRRAGSERRVSVAEPTATVVFAASTRDTDAGLVAESSAMKDLLEMARRLSRGVIPVLLHGETGTGKEVLARFIHDHGPRKDQPLIAVNCAAIPQQLVESTLFGHEKGAFTGATQLKKGVFEAAQGGTVLLDEIGELPPAAQAALLRVLETKRVTRVGSTKEIDVDVRIVAASHRDLEAMCRTGAFREDLLYRLNALTLDVPPLRDRRDDIAPLALRFLEQANRANRRSLRGLESSALAALGHYHWPGNVRELRNAIERAVVIAEHDVVTVHDLPRRVRETAERPLREPARDGMPSPERLEASAASGLRGEAESFRECMERLEASVILETLLRAAGNQSEAARMLQMPRRTLVHKIKLHGLKKSAYGLDEL